MKLYIVSYMKNIQNNLNHPPKFYVQVTYVNMLTIGGVFPSMQ